ncbi:MAG: hypothetical protein OXN89_09475 [Bryobacterales bacterium]|nr:hypothetical protein [Bryobacterales bacterium]
MSKKSKLEKAEQTPLEIELSHTTYQRGMAEVRKEFDMPAASLERIQRAFLWPVVVRRNNRRKRADLPATSRPTVTVRYDPLHTPTLRQKSLNWIVNDGKLSVLLAFSSRTERLAAVQCLRCAKQQTQRSPREQVAFRQDSVQQIAECSHASERMP